MGLATVQEKRDKKKKIVGYVVVRDGRDIKAYSKEDYPSLGRHGAKDRAFEHARKLNGGVSI